MPFHLYTSNRLEILSEDLSRVLTKPLASPLQPEIILVQSRGMERWLSLQLAKKQGICANIRFPFPNTFVNEIFSRVGFPTEEDDTFHLYDGMNDAYDPEVLTWQILNVLDDCLEKAEFAPLRKYLHGPSAELKRLQLATRVADLFDQYLLFRPEMIKKWEGGEETHWQAQLWRRVTGQIQTPHRVELGRKLIHLIESGQLRHLDLPSRISVFGISTLPEFHMKVLDAVAQLSDVNLFLMNPCREYWGDIVSDSEIGRAMKKQKKDDLTLELFHFEKGNSLLASFGKLGRDFFDLIEEKFDYQSRENFVQPVETTLLETIQSHILNLYEPSLVGDQKQEIKATDKSLQIHSCHSPRREIEILHDYLLDLFEQDPTIRPSDILVKAPDIEPYVPYIQAVFDLPYDDRKRIPFSIADRNFTRENSVVASLFNILDLVGSRFAASQILTILESPDVCRRFGITEEDLELIQTWIKKTRIRWGVGAEHRRELGLPDYPQNTWRAGLDRLLLGYALAGHDCEPYQESILPYEDIEGNQAAALGKLAEFIERVSETVQVLKIDRSLDEWSRELSDLLERFFEVSDSNIGEIQVVRNTLAHLEALRKLSRFEQKIPLSMIRYYLQSRLQLEGYGYGFLTGGVTFCSMLPMRSIPAKVLCLIGMNHDRYPRQNKQFGFDLIARNPRRGDRSRRTDDRYLFLEAILSARTWLYMSYIGQSIRDNSIIPASVVVSELLDYVDANFTVPGSSVFDAIVTKHRLQAFSPQYFTSGTSLFSYSEENRAAAENQLRDRSAPQSFISDSGLPESEEEFKTVHLMDLYRFFRNPVRFLYNRRLNLYLREEPDVLLDEEDFSLSPLDRYKIAQTLSQTRISETDVEGVKSSFQAAGQLPHGQVGEYEYEQLLDKVEHFVEKTRDLIAERELSPLDVDLDLSGYRVIGKLEHITAKAQAHYRFARVRAKDHLLAWLNHLVLNILREPGYPTLSFLAGIESMKSGKWLGWTLQLVQNAEGYLTELLHIYWHGLHKPVHFFPNSTLEYAQALRAGKSMKTALWWARKTWEGGEGERGEKEDPYFSSCFGSHPDPFNDSFKDVAMQVWSPVFDHQEQI